MRAASQNISLFRSSQQWIFCSKLVLSFCENWSRSTSAFHHWSRRISCLSTTANRASHKLFHSLSRSRLQKNNFISPVQSFIESSRASCSLPSRRGAAYIVCKIKLTQPRLRSATTLETCLVARAGGESSNIRPNPRRSHFAWTSDLNCKRRNRTL